MIQEDKIQDKIQKIKKELRETPYHKGTQHYIGELRARLSKLEDKLLAPSKKGGGIGFNIRKEGDAQIVLLGFPSSGKSTLINALTNAHSKVASYAFTTTTAIPGMMNLNGALIQLVDLPGFIIGASANRGHGKEILGVARQADLLLLVYDLTKPGQIDKILKEIKESEIEKDFLIVGNKSDLKTISNKNYDKEDTVFISAINKIGLEDLKEKIWTRLNFMRIFLKPQNGQIDYKKPLILKNGASVYDAAEKVSTELKIKLKEAKVWGKSAKFPGQIVSLYHHLADQDILTLFF